MRMSLLPFAALACLFIGADETKDAAIKKEREKLVGTWKVVTMERNGEKFDDETATQLTVEFDAEGKWILKIAGNELMNGKSKLDPTKKPKEMDFTYDDGDEKLLKGIYELDGDTLKSVYSRAGDEGRPTKLESKAGSGHTYTVYSRAKK